MEIGVKREIYTDIEAGAMEKDMVRSCPPLSLPCQLKPWHCRSDPQARLTPSQSCLFAECLMAHGVAVFFLLLTRMFIRCIIDVVSIWQDYPSQSPH